MPTGTHTGRGCLIAHASAQAHEKIRRHDHSWNHRDAGDRVNFVPLRMKGVLHVTAHYPDPRADWREHDMVRIALARTSSVLLRQGKPAYDFEHEVTVFIAHVAGIQQILKLGVHFQPSVCVPTVRPKVIFIWSPRVSCLGELCKVRILRTPERHVRWPSADAAPSRQRYPPKL